MGVKGVHVTCGLIGIGNLLLIIALFNSWQHTSVLGGVAMKEHIASVDVGHSLMVQLLPTEYKRKHDNFQGTLVQCREIFCGITASKLAMVMCQKFTMDMVVGILVCILFSIAIVLDLVAGLYLLYYKSGRAKKEYRKIAFRCLVVSPVLIFLGIFAYSVSLIYTLTMDFPISIVSTVLPIVVTPDAGIFLAIFGFFILSFVPCLSRQWMLFRGEMMDSERRNNKKEAMERMVWENNYNGVGTKSVADVASGAPYFDNDFVYSHNIQPYSGAPQYPPCVLTYPQHHQQHQPSVDLYVHSPPHTDPYAQPHGGTSNHNGTPPCYPSAGPDPALGANHGW